MTQLEVYIRRMHNKFGLTGKPMELPEEKYFRHTCLEEEVREYLEAETPEQELDALVDLVIFALGTADRHGWLNVFEEAFNRVMHKNMEKELGGNAKRGGFELDLVKPEGWEPADLSDLVDYEEKYHGQ